MTSQRESNLEELKEWLIRLERKIQADKSLRHQNSSIELEFFFRDLLNLVFPPWGLDNANALFGKNQDSFDLSDTTQKVAVQVTITTGPEKIRKTLKGFIGKHDKTYQRLIFVYPNIEFPDTRANFDADLKGYDFDPKRDRIGLGAILQQAQNMDVAGQQELLNFIRQELAPLGKAMQFGVDQTMETLIAVIEYMSRNSPIDKLDFDEKQPDIQLKLTRFQAHAAYLLAQYRINQTLHATVDQAKAAIGYDVARVTKIQAWLKLHSIAALERFANNAMEAFESLVKDLLARAHSRGTNAEETAVRFLLALEFIGCNVFPNP